VAGRRRRRVRDAVHEAEAATGLQLCVYLGAAIADPAEVAERLFTDRHPDVLVVVATDARRVEIRTAERARARVPDAACDEAIERMRPMLQRGAYDEALVVGLRFLAATAGSGEPAEGSTDLPDLFEGL
jgi:uncharacterized membrane protein YgcG